MPSVLEPLILDMLEWVASEGRTYSEVMKIWRTSCPRLSVWEEAIDRGYINVLQRDGINTVIVTPTGFNHLNAERPKLPLLPPTSSIAVDRAS